MITNERFALVIMENMVSEITPHRCRYCDSEINYHKSGCITYAAKAVLSEYISEMHDEIALVERVKRILDYC